MSLAPLHLVAAFVLAQGGGVTNSLSWAIVIFAVVLGLLIALRSSRRTTEFKRPKDH